MKINTKKNYVNAEFLSLITGFRAGLLLGLTYQNKYGEEEIVQQCKDEALHKIEPQFVMNIRSEIYVRKLVKLVPSSRYYQLEILIESVFLRQ